MQSIQNRNSGCRASEFSIGGTPAIALENSVMRVGVLAGKGGDIYELLHKPTDTDVMYRAPGGLRLLSRPTASVQGGGGAFWDSFVGGWFEMLPNAGAACTVMGAALGTHGELMMLPWEYTLEQDCADGAAVVLRTHGLRYPIAAEKRLSIKKDSGRLEISERVTNTSAVPLPFEWGHHITMGDAFLNEHCVIELAPATLLHKPEYHTDGSRVAKECYGVLDAMPGRDGGFVDLSELPPKGAGITETLFAEFEDDPWFRVTDRAKGLGFGVKWDRAAFPCMWVWQEFNYTQDYPFYGGCYAMALEPMSGNTPTLEAARGDKSCHVLNPGQSMDAFITAELLYTGK